MRILYDNLLEAASLSATNEDANYPVTNVTDTTLQTEFRATTNSTKITATLASASSISALAFGNHNINTLTVTLTDSLMATTVKNYTATDLKFSDSVTQAIVYFTAVTDVVEIEYDISTVTTTFVGGLSAGSYLQMPAFNAAYNTGFDSTGTRQKSRDGVTFNVPGVTLETFSASFDGVTLTDYNLINAFFGVVQTYQPYYVDKFEGTTDFPVVFAQNTNDVSWTANPGGGIVFDAFTLDFEECK